MGTGASVHVHSEPSSRSAEELRKSLQRAALSRLAQENEGSGESASSHSPPTTAARSSSTYDTKAVQSSGGGIVINVKGLSEAKKVASIPTISIDQTHESRRGPCGTRTSAFAAAGRSFFASSRSRWSRSPSPSSAPLTCPLVHLIVKRTGSSYALVSSTYEDAVISHRNEIPTLSVTTSSLNVHPPPVTSSDHALTAALPGGTPLEKAQALEV